MDMQIPRGAGEEVDELDDCANGEGAAEEDDTELGGTADEGEVKEEQEVEGKEKGSEEPQAGRWEPDDKVEGADLISKKPYIKARRDTDIWEYFIAMKKPVVDKRSVAHSWAVESYTKLTDEKIWAYPTMHDGYLVFMHGNIVYATVQQDASIYSTDGEYLNSLLCMSADDTAVGELEATVPGSTNSDPAVLLAKVREMKKRIAEHCASFMIDDHVIELCFNAQAAASQNDGELTTTLIDALQKKLMTAMKEKIELVALPVA
ncbi:hypothetical protein B0A50_00934 [Salinomyces thailandicus]|uniref:Uncharacterized protein n=1 Tax=Salinomyces thailandicus TaxID=706561 RepID=A0A4V5N7K1_9PEZI|nr:hypothetical protein B0A50_00934 [Salinomyces thailandica]